MRNAACRNGSSPGKRDESDLRSTPDNADSADGPTPILDPSLLTDPTRRTWTRREARSALGISRSAFEHLTRAGRIPYAKRGPGDYVFDADAILSALAAQAQETRR